MCAVLVVADVRADLEHSELSYNNKAQYAL